MCIHAQLVRNRPMVLDLSQLVKTDRQIDRQTDRWIDRQIDRWTDRQTTICFEDLGRFTDKVKYSGYVRHIDSDRVGERGEAGGDLTYPFKRLREILY